MIASNTITVAHAEALLKATPHEQRTDLQGLKRDRKTPPIEQLVKIEKSARFRSILRMLNSTTVQTF